MTSREDRQLHIIKEILAVAAEDDVQVWLRGGWAVDFSVGEITRAHEDIDWFMWADDADVFTLRLRSHGYEQLYEAPPGQQRDSARTTST